MDSFDLHNEKLKSGFTPPEGYFESFEAKIMQQTTEKRTKVVALPRSKMWFSGMAAALALFFFVTKNNTNNDFDSLDTSTIETYLASEFSMYEITEKLEAEDIDNLDEWASINTESLESYFEDNQNLEYYLNE